jgi:predicted NBD/HSP70 family sugar kinase
MSTRGIARRALMTGCGALALVPMLAGGDALAQRPLAVRGIRVDVSPLRAAAGDPTARWVEQELSRQLAQALANRSTSGGGALIVRIDDLSLGAIKDSSARDNIGGVVMVGGAAWPVRATTRYRASPVDQTMIEQSNHYRVSALVEALAFWIARDLGS